MRATALCLQEAVEESSPLALDEAAQTHEVAAALQPPISMEAEGVGEGDLSSAGWAEGPLSYT